MLRYALTLIVLMLVSATLAQKRDRFTLYDQFNDKPRWIKEGKQVELSLLPDRCAGWEQRSWIISGQLLLVEDSSITIFFNGEDLICTHGDSTFTWNNRDVDEGTGRTIPNSRIFWVEKQHPNAGSIFGGIAGAAFMSAIFVAPLASIKWFDGWDFNADTYTFIAGTSLIVAGVSFPLAGAFGSPKRLVPKGHATE